MGGGAKRSGFGWEGGEAGLEEIRSYLHGLGFERRGRGPVGTLGWDELWVNPRFPPRSAAESM